MHCWEAREHLWIRIFDHSDLGERLLSEKTFNEPFPICRDGQSMDDKYGCCVCQRARVVYPLCHNVVSVDDHAVDCFTFRVLEEDSVDVGAGVACLICEFYRP